MDTPILSQSVLVLNAGMIPIEICTVRKAILDIFRNVAVPVQESPYRLRSPSISVAVPLIIARVKYHKIPKRDVALNKWNIMQRDDLTCQYCKGRGSLSDLTIDHIVPRSRWRTWKKQNADLVPREFNSWENLTTACRKCNSAKGNKLLKELGWKLEPAPVKPIWLPQLVISRTRAESMGWLEYCRFNVKLVEQVQA